MIVNLIFLNLKQISGYVVTILRNHVFTVDPDLISVSGFRNFFICRLPQRPPIQARLPPLMREEWESYRQLDGTISNENEIAFRARVFAGVSSLRSNIDVSEVLYL